MVRRNSAEPDAEEFGHDMRNKCRILLLLLMPMVFVACDKREPKNWQESVASISPVDISNERIITVPFESPLYYVSWAPDGSAVFVVDSHCNSYVVTSNLLVIPLRFPGGEKPCNDLPPDCEWITSLESNRSDLLVAHPFYGGTMTENILAVISLTDAPIHTRIALWDSASNFRSPKATSDVKGFHSFDFVAMPNSTNEFSSLRSSGLAPLLQEIDVVSNGRAICRAVMGLHSWATLLRNGNCCLILDQGGITAYSISPLEKLWYVSEKQDSAQGYLYGNWHSFPLTICEQSDCFAYLYVEHGRKDKTKAVIRSLSNGNILHEFILPLKREEVALCRVSSNELALVCKKGQSILFNPTTPTERRLLDLRSINKNGDLIKWSNCFWTYNDPGIHFSNNGSRALVIDDARALHLITIDRNKGQETEQTPAGDVPKTAPEK